MIRAEANPFSPVVRNLSDIERDDIVRKTIAEGINRIDRQHGNPTYRQAWKIAINILKGMEPRN